MRSAIILWVGLNALSGQADTTTIKYFKTSLLRSAILRNEIDAKDVRKNPHFKAVYDGNGKLLNIEYIPAPWDKPGRRKSVKSKNLKLYYKTWNPRRTELAEGLTRKEARGKKYFEALLNRDGKVVSVTEIHPSGRRKWTYHLQPESNDYSIEFHSNGTILALDNLLFADAVSEVRRGWNALYKTRKDGRPKQVHVQDRLGQRVYYYTITFGASRNQEFSGKTIKSEYFKDDKSKVGHHEMIFDKKRRLTKVEYFDRKDNLIQSFIHEYRDALKEKVISTINEKGKMVERK